LTGGRPAITRRARVDAGLAILFGAAFLLFAGWTVLATIRTIFYRPIQGRVLSSRIDTIRGAKGNSYRPEIEYSYTVDGVRLRNDAYAPSTVNPGGSDHWAAEVARRYPEGAACTVYYDPADPSRSVLSRTPTPAAVAEVALISLLGLVLATWGFLGAPSPPSGRRTPIATSGSEGDRARSDREVTAAAEALSDAIRRLEDLRPEYERVARVGDREKLDRFEAEAWRPACEQLARAESRLLDAVEEIPHRRRRAMFRVR
jgi:hypothetical protein